MKYCYTTTSGQTICTTYPICLEDFNTIIVREGYGGPIPFFGNAEIVINCDTLEIEISKAAGNPPLNSSMDVAFGISDTNNSELVLVEIRLNYTNPNNVSRSKLFQKVHGTINAIVPNVPIHNQIVFLFDTRIKAEARNRLARMDPKVPSSFVVMDLPQLKASYF